MHINPENAALIESILALSRALHLETVAEGVERFEQLARLRTLGADLAQGYYFARPLIGFRFVSTSTARSKRVERLLDLGAAAAPTYTRNGASQPPGSGLLRPRRRPLGMIDWRCDTRGSSVKPYGGPHIERCRPARAVPSGGRCREIVFAMA